MHVDHQQPPLTLLAAIGSKIKSLNSEHLSFSHAITVLSGHGQNHPLLFIRPAPPRHPRCPRPGYVVLAAVAVPHRPRLCRDHPVERVPLPVRIGGLLPNPPQPHRRGAVSVPQGDLHVPTPQSDRFLFLPVRVRDEARRSVGPGILGPALLQQLGPVRGQRFELRRDHVHPRLDC